MQIDSSRIIASGTWLYDGTVECKVIIVREKMMPGSGDYQDPPEISEDREVECYQVLYEAAGTPGAFKAGGGYFLTVERAREAVEDTLPVPIEWEE